jgi:hypothetical protein
LTVGFQRDARSKQQHAERIVHGFIVSANDAYASTLQPIGITVLTEKQAFPQDTLSRLGRPVKDESSRSRAALVSRHRNPAALGHEMSRRSSLSPALRRHEFDLEPDCLFHTPIKKICSGDTVWKPKVVLHLNFPFCQGSARVDQQRIPPASTEIQSGRQPGQSSANDDDFSDVCHTETSHSLY